MKIIDEEDYITPNVPRYIGHPLINALGHTNSSSTTKKMLRKTPEILEEALALPAHEKTHEIMAILDSFFHPTSSHLELEQDLSKIIRQGYLSRNLANKGRVETLKTAKKFLDEYKNNESIKTPKLRYNDGSKALITCLTGCSGTGKSTTTQAILDSYEQVIHHKKYQHTQVVWLKLECPHSGSEKALCINFFQALDKILETDYEKMFVTSRASVEILLSQMVNIAALHSIGILVIDEIQHLHRFGDKVRESLINFLVAMSNVINIPILFIGTPKANGIFGQTMRFARRAIQLGGTNWGRLEKSGSIKKGKTKKEDQRGDWEKFFNALWKLQWFNNPVPLTQEISNLFFEYSQGIAHIAVVLFFKSQERAININRELIDHKIVNKIYNEKFGIVHPMIAALKSGKKKEILKYADLDLPLDDIINDEQQLNDSPTGDRNSYLLSKLPQLTSLLVQLSYDASDAHLLAKEAIKNSPDEEIGTLVTNIITSKAPPPPPKKAQRKVQEKLTPVYVDSDDVRLLRHDDPEDNYQALERNRLIIDLEESLKLGRFVG